MPAWRKNKMRLAGQLATDRNAVLHGKERATDQVSSPEISFPMYV